MSVDEDITRGRACNQRVYAKDHSLTYIDEYAGIFLHFHKYIVKKYYCCHYILSQTEIEHPEIIIFLHLIHRYEDI